jgi:hypothetical protein
MADVCGPFTLDQLDGFGTLDSLAFSLDSAIWTSADTCILESSGAITGEGSAESGGYVIRGGEAVITASGAVVADAYRERTFEAIIVGSGALASDGIRMRTASGAITGELTMSATGGFEAFGIAFLLGDGELVIDTQVTAAGEGKFTGTWTVDTTGYIYGEEWRLVPAETNVWVER